MRRIYLDNVLADLVEIPNPESIHPGMRIRLTRGGVTETFVVAEMTDDALRLHSLTAAGLLDFPTRVEAAWWS